MVVYLGADHRGFKLKEKLRDHLADEGVKVVDMGTDSDEPVDYPLIAQKVAGKVRQDSDDRGVLVCGSSAGVSIAANKVKGIRAFQAWTEEVARATRNDDDGNVLCLSADLQTLDEVKPIIKAFLSTPFDKAERRVRRLDQIKTMEDMN